MMNVFHTLETIHKLQVFAAAGVGVGGGSDAEEGEDGGQQQQGGSGAAGAGAAGKMNLQKALKYFSLAGGWMRCAYLSVCVWRGWDLLFVGE